MIAAETFLDGKVQMHCGDCLDVLATLEENSIDSCVTDPPYHLTSIVKRFGKEGSAPVRSNLERDPNTIQDWGRTSPYQRAASGFMGKQWDGGDIAFRPEVWREVFRVLKPGSHLLAMGGDRTYHRLASAIEDAGFEIRGTVAWIFGSGFPKNHDISKAIDRAAGAERELTKTGQVKRNGYGGWDTGSSDTRPRYDIPATPAARQWEGFGTALKPAMELICLARKPLSERTVAANVLKWGTGAINVDGCRVESNDGLVRPVIQRNDNEVYGKGLGAGTQIEPNGRWPANVIHDGSAEVVEAFPESIARNGGTTNGCAPDSGYGMRATDDCPIYRDSGSAARFFYSSKADADDRLGSRHPTIKPLDLMQYLVRLITPPKGTCLDPFAGTGTTGEAAFREGMRAVLIEREAEYQDDIRRRMKLCLSGPDERARESIKQRMKDKPVDNGPLFDTYDADDDMRRSVQDCFREVKKRVAEGGPGWGDWPPDKS